MSSLGPIGNKANTFESLVPVATHFPFVLALPTLLLRKNNAQRINFQLIFTLTQIGEKILINFHASALQRINLQLICTLTQIGGKIRIDFHASALQRMNFQLIFTLTQIRVKIQINFHNAALQQTNFQ